MAILTLDQLWAAAKQAADIKKTASRTAIANTWFSIFDQAGSPGAGTLAGSSTTAGVVPTDATAGYPTINPFGGTNEGYLSSVEFGSSVACRIRLFDRLFLAGAYAFNANQALSGQPSYLSRIPGGAAINTAGETELWVEQVTAATGNQAVNVTYTNELGTASRTTGAVGVGAAPTVGRCWQLPLAAGDRGVAAVNNVVGSVATAGTFNVMVLRPLWTGRIKIANDGDIHDWFRTQGRKVFEDSALYMLISPDSTATGTPDVRPIIAAG